MRKSLHSQDFDFPSLKYSSASQILESSTHADIMEFLCFRETHNALLLPVFSFFLIGIHSMQRWTATARHGVTRKRNTTHNALLLPVFSFFLIGIHSMQRWTATARHGVTRKRNTKRLKHTGNLFRKNLRLKSVC